MPIEMVWMLAGAGCLGIVMLGMDMLKTWSVHREVQRLGYIYELGAENTQLRGYLMDIVEKFPEGIPVESEFEACPWCHEHYFYAPDSLEVTPHAETCPFMGAVKFLNGPRYEEAPIG